MKETLKIFYRGGVGASAFLRPELRLVAEGDPARGGVEAFAADLYARHFGADLRAFSRELLILAAEDGRPLSCVGLNMPEEGSLFLEQYLDAPVEEALSTALGRAVARHEMVEVGTMAIGTRGLCRVMMAALTGVVSGRDRRYLVFTAVRSLQNTLSRLDIPFVVLAEADPGRLTDRSTDWGQYYAASPRVMAVDLVESFGRVDRILAAESGRGRDVARLMTHLFIEGRGLSVPLGAGRVA